METTLECPFCKRNTIKAFRRPSYLGHKTTRISAGAKTTYFRVPESYEIKSGCSNCSKSLKKVKEAYEGKKKISHGEIIKLWKEQGVPLVWESK